MAATVLDKLEKAEALQSIMLARATGTTNSDTDGEDYIRLRRELISDPEIKPHLPKEVVSCPRLDHFWPLIQSMFPSYRERRTYLREQFSPLWLALEPKTASASEDFVTGVLATVTWDRVQRVWEKALERKANDPEGAITAARTLVESVCKHILDEKGVVYDGKEDLPKLYGMTVEQLTLAPYQQSEQTLKQILGGCKTITEGMGALRNQIGDAHGKGASHPDIDSFYAELAINAAGTLATFLVRVYEHAL